MCVGGRGAGDVRVFLISREEWGDGGSSKVFVLYDDRLR